VIIDKGLMDGLIGGGGDGGYENRSVRLSMIFWHVILTSMWQCIAPMASTAPVLSAAAT